MKFSLSWLKEFLETDAPLQAITNKLTAIGLEVDAVSNPAEALASFTVAEILHAEKHPEADKLRVCRVASDAGELQIVCGAPNARAGIKVALAKEGALIPANGMVIRKSKIRGVESHGMLCSGEELGIGGDGNGILELPEEAPIGRAVAVVLGLDDAVVEINVTPNRSDCLGVYGIARDLAAAGLGTLKALSLETTPSPLRGEDWGRGEIPPASGEALHPLPNPPPSRGRELCPLLIACRMTGLTNGESPDWLKRRLESVGLRPISTLVDITNYFTRAFARPMHAYDAAKLNGGLTAREARAGEKLKALDGKEYALTPGMTVIADDNGVLGLGGIIGGEASACSAKTTSIVLEIALFDPVNIAETGRKLEILTDARYRFERGVDPAFAEPAARLACAMITELCGGKVDSITIAGAAPDAPSPIAFSPSRVEALSGVNLPEAAMETILTALGFVVNPQPNGWQVTPPSWRADVNGEADLVEEILRMHGYDAIPAMPLPQAPLAMPAPKRAETARRLLAARGGREICSYSFISAEAAARFGGASEGLTLLNPISVELAVMRPSLLPGLLAAAEQNKRRGAADLFLFETGLQFTTPDGQLLMTSGLLTGSQMDHAYPQSKFHQIPRLVDAFDAKAELLALVFRFGLVKHDVRQGAPEWYHPGRSGTVVLGKQVLGYFGELHPAIAQAYDLPQAVAFELFLERLPQPRAGKAKPAFKANDFPAVQRDFAFVVKESVSVADIIKALNAAEKQLVTKLELFDVYSGQNVPEGHKSVALQATLQASDRTLAEVEINAVSQKLVSAAAAFGGQLRA